MIDTKMKLLQIKGNRTQFKKNLNFFSTNLHVHKLHLLSLIIVRHDIPSVPI